MSKIIVGLYGSTFSQETSIRHGNARCGKDTFAELVQGVNPDWTIYALSSPIKEVINNLMGWNEEHSDGDLKEVELTTKLSSNWVGELALELEERFGSVAEDTGFGSENLLSHFCDVFNLSIQDDHITISPRRAYQLFGTEFGRAISNSIWLDLIPTDKPFVIITDVRFPNEVSWCNDNGAFLLGIERTLPEAELTILPAHSSEQACDTSCLDGSITNNGTIDELDEVASLFDEYLQVSTFGDVQMPLQTYLIEQGFTVGKPTLTLGG